MRFPASPNSKYIDPLNSKFVFVPTRVNLRPGTDTDVTVNVTDQKRLGEITSLFESGTVAGDRIWP